MAKPSIAENAITQAMGLIARALAWGRLDVSLMGIQKLPSKGPVLLVARHFHHLFDGVALYQAMPRPIHILVTLDWAPNRLTKLWMELITTLARWPVLLRRDALIQGDNNHPLQERSIFTVADAARFQRRAMRDCIQLLCEERVLLVFPEGYPNIDPNYTPKKNSEEMLPFKSGFAVILAAAEKRLKAEIPVLPVGLRYEKRRRWHAEMRLGPPVYAAQFPTRDLLVSFLEGQVATLSGLREGSLPHCRSIEGV